MRFALLASGSKGNAALIESGADLILLDCGLSGARLKKSMQELGSDPAELTTIIITHEHSDHVNGLAKIASLTSISPYMTRGTAQKLKLRDNDFVHIQADTSIQLPGGTSFMPYAIPHDAREAIHIYFHGDDAKLGFATDIGKPNSYLCEVLAGCNALVLECNYDADMLNDNVDYPHWLKQRICGGKGHMSNDQAAKLLHNICHDRLRTVVAAHLSENNNTSEKARNALLAQLRNSGYSPTLSVVPQHHTSQWFEVV